MSLLDLADRALAAAAEKPTPPAFAAADTRPVSVGAMRGADPGSERRKRALAMLEEDPSRRVAVVAQRGDPAHVTVAVRGVAVGELEIPAEKYDAFDLMALMDKHGHA